MKIDIPLVAVLILLQLLLFPTGSSECEESTSPLSSSARSIEVPYTDEPPVLDGVIGSTEWKTYLYGWYFDADDGISHREKYNDTVNGDDEEFGNSRDLSADFYLLYDEEYLYISANVSDEDIVVDSYPEDPSKYYRDDGLEVLIDGAHDKDPDQRAPEPWPGWEDGTTLLILADNSYHHDYSLGHGYPYGRRFGEEKAWYGIASPDPTGGYYTVEMRIRLENISSPEPNSTIGLNIGVNDDDTGGLSKTALKWAGGDFTPYVNDVFKNETKWGSAHLLTFVEARAPREVFVDEDTEVILSGVDSVGNHPDFQSMANYTWSRSIWNGYQWENVTKYGEETSWNFPHPDERIRIVLEVTDPAGISDTASTYITVNDTTPPNIDAVDDTAYEEEIFVYVLNVTDQSGIDRCIWNIETLPIFTTHFPSFNHTFEHPGDFKVSVDVFDIFNNSASADFTVSVIDTKPPTPILGFQKLTVASGERFYLDASRTFDDNPNMDDPDWLNFTWRINMGDMEINRFGENISLSLEIPGIWECNLTVTDGAGNPSWVDLNITVEDIRAPLVDFNLIPEIKEDSGVNLTGLLTVDDDPRYPIGFTFLWTYGVSHSKGEFEDTKNGSSVSLIFPHPGEGWVNLTVIDRGGNEGYLNRSVTILDATPPVARLNLPVEIEEDKEIILDASPSSDNTGIDWIRVRISKELEDDPIWTTPAGGIYVGDIPTEQFDSLEELRVTIPDPGRYVLTLEVEDKVGLTDSISMDIDVLDITSPEAAINRSYLVLFQGEIIYLSGAESRDNFGGLEFQWEINSTGEVFFGPEFEYLAEAGSYNITLTVTDRAGNVDSAWCEVLVKGKTGAVDSDDWASLYLWIAVIVALIIALITATLYILRSKRRISPGTEIDYPEE